MRAAFFMLGGLALGFAAGMLLSAADHPAVGWFVALVEPVGTLFVNAIRMTVIPLIVSKLVVAVASTSDERAMKRIGGGAGILFVGTVALAAAFGAVVSSFALPYLRIDGSAGALLRAAGGATAGMATTGGAAGAAARGALPSLSQFFVGLVPANPFKALADGALLPLVVFALGLGFALTRVPPGPRDVVVRIFQAVADAMVVIIRWVLKAAPLGVFALAVPLASRLGFGAVGALAFYIALVAATCVAFAAVVLYPAAVLLGRVPLRQFARALAPVQAIAFSSRSSLATLPVMVEQGKNALKLPEAVTAFFLPVAAALFRGGSAIGTTIGALFLAHLYGVSLGPSGVAIVALTAVVTMFGSPGVPSGAVLIIVPILASAGVPVEGIGILLGVDTLPDMFRTTTNVTATMSGATVLGRLAGSDAS